MASSLWAANKSIASPKWSWLPVLLQHRLKAERFCHRVEVLFFSLTIGFLDSRPNAAGRAHQPAAQIAAAGSPDRGRPIAQYGKGGGTARHHPTGNIEDNRRPGKHARHAPLRSQQTRRGT